MKYVNKGHVLKSQATGGKSLVPANPSNTMHISKELVGWLVQQHGR